MDNENTNKEKVQINLDKGQKELIIRHGDAAPPEVPRKIHVSGRITAPGAYIEARKGEIDHKSCHVLVNRDAMTIKLITEDRSEHATTIDGALTYDKFFASFGINEDKEWSLNTLANHLKMHKYYFQDNDDGAKVISELKQFKGKISTTMEDSNDDRGQMKKLIEKQLDSNVPMSFDLSIPIFKGQEKSVFKVEIAIELRDAAVAVSLISPEVSEIIQNVVDQIIDTELKHFSIEYYTILEV